jgi:nucleoside-diphosphate-sugar epimerase
MRGANLTVQTAIVTGASGFIGTRLVKHLKDSGVADVRAWDIAPPRVRLPGVDYQVLDVREPIPAQRGEGAQIIYNLAAVHRTPGHPAEQYYETNILGAANICALAEAAGIREIVFTSSISVYGPSEDMLSETSPLKPVSHYGKSKRMAEVLHRQWADRADDRRLVVVRPGVVFGPGENGNYTYLARSLKKGRFVYPGRKTTIKSGGYVDELLRTLAFARTVNTGTSTFNFAYPDQSSTEDIVKTFGRVTGFKSNYPVVPVAPLLLAATLFEVANALGVKNPVHRERVMKLVQSTRIAPEWLLANGYVFSTRLEQALEHWRDETQGTFA